MSRAASAAVEAFLHGYGTGDGLVRLVRIDHADFGTLRYTDAGIDVVSNGETYVARGFKSKLPGDEDGIVDVPFELDITDLDDDLVASIVAAEGDPPTVEMDLVLISDLDDVGATFFYEMKNAVAPAQVLTATLSYEPLRARPYPGFVFDATGYPDLFE